MAREVDQADFFTNEKQVFYRAGCLMDRHQILNLGTQVQFLTMLDIINDNFVQFEKPLSLPLMGEVDLCLVP